MYERYNEEARRAISFAVWEARQAGSVYVEPAHLLLSLTHDVNNNANQLFLLTAHTENFRKEVKLHSSAKSTSSVDLPLSNASKRILAYTAEEADRLTSKPIGTEHLLLGLLREKKSGVQDTLAKVGIDLRSARNRIRQECNLPLLERKMEGGEHSLKPLRPFAALALLIVVLSLICLIMRLVSK